MDWTCADLDDCMADRLVAIARKLEQQPQTIRTASGEGDYEPDEGADPETIAAFIEARDAMRAELAAADLDPERPVSDLRAFVQRARDAWREMRDSRNQNPED